MNLSSTIIESSRKAGRAPRPKLVSTTRRLSSSLSLGPSAPPPSQEWWCLSRQRHSSRAKLPACNNQTIFVTVTAGKWSVRKAALQASNERKNCTRTPTLPTWLSPSRTAKQCWLRWLFKARRTQVGYQNSNNLNLPATLRTQKHN